MIYLDTSVVVARLFAEVRAPADSFWSQTFVASRLLEFEVFNRVHARAAAAYAVDARHLVDRVNLIEMSEAVLGRALLPFSRPLRTLDALHLATMDFLRGRGISLTVATYDQRLAQAATELGFALADC